MSSADPSRFCSSIPHPKSAAAGRRAAREPARHRHRWSSPAGGRGRTRSGRRSTPLDRFARRVQRHALERGPRRRPRRRQPGAPLGPGAEPRAGSSGGRSLICSPSAACTARRVARPPRERVGVRWGADAPPHAGCRPPHSGIMSESSAHGGSSETRSVSLERRDDTRCDRMPQPGLRSEPGPPRARRASPPAARTATSSATTTGAAITHRVPACSQMRVIPIASSPHRTD